MNSEDIASKLRKKQKKLAGFAKNLPDVPGVYLMRMDDDFLLYIGKANSLQKRYCTYRNY
jgi:excinuclease UvrABC nuclease subunit